MKTLKYLISIIILVSALLSAGCEADKDNPFQDPRDQFLGIWKVVENCTRLNYNVNISYDPQNSAQVLIENFGNPGNNYPPAIALVAGNKIYVNSQTIGDNWVVGGDGILIEAGRVEWDYNLEVSGTLHVCTAVYTK